MGIFEEGQHTEGAKRAGRIFAPGPWLKRPCDHAMAELEGAGLEAAARCSERRCRQARRAAAPDQRAANP